MKKRVYAILLAAVMTVVSLTACSGKNETEKAVSSIKRGCAFYLLCPDVCGD